MFVKFCTDIIVSCLEVTDNYYYYRFAFDKQHYGKSKEYFSLRKMQLINNTQYAYRKCETLVRVFSQTLVHGNSTIEKVEETE